MEYEEIIEAIELHQKQVHLSFDNLELARKIAKQAYNEQLSSQIYSSKLRLQLKRVEKAVKQLDGDGIRYLDRYANAEGKSGHLREFSEILSLAIDVLGIEGRKILPLDKAILYLLGWWVSQGNKVTNTLKQSTSSKLGNSPSKTVAFLHVELKEFDNKITMEQIHNTLRRSEVRQHIKSLISKIQEL